MKRKIVIVLLIGVISLLGIIPALAGEYEYVDALTAEMGTVQIDSFKEAPELRVKVAAGELPPIEERIPQEPLVVEPIEKIGTYGGTLVDSRTRQNKFSRPDYHLYEFFLSFNFGEQNKVYPNIVKGWEFLDEGKTIRFFLRKGMKWSDGAPFTADDVLFWYEDIYLNKELYPTPPGLSTMTIGGEMGVVKKIDDYTVDFSFVATVGQSFLNAMARFRPVSYSPKHYLKQFHPKYTAQEKIDKMVKEGKYDSWSAFFMDQMGWGGENYRCPTLAAWKMMNDPTEPVHIWERNPYYWKVDTEGNQLPYIGRVEAPAVLSTEGRLLKVLAGEVSWDYLPNLGPLAVYSIVMAGREKGDYRVIPWNPNRAINGSALVFNYAHKDPVLREIFNDKRFRHAISLALDREEVNDLLYFGLSDLRQMGLPEGPPWYGEGPIFQRYVERDVAEANRLLDEMGLVNRDEEGYRLRPDGEKLEINNTVLQQGYPEYPEVAELYKKHLEDVGIRMYNKPQLAKIISDEKLTADFDVHTIPLGFGASTDLITRGVLLPVHDEWLFGAEWAKWLVTNGEQGVEPPAGVKRLRAIFDEGMEAISEEKMRELVLEAADIHTEELYAIPGLTTPLRYARSYVAKNDLRNVSSPDGYCDWWIYTIPVATVFFENQQ